MAKKRRKELLQALSNMGKIPNNFEGKAFEDEVKKLKIPVLTAGMDNIKYKCIQRVHTDLQTETMLDACIFAKWSCFLAAIAAIVACISVILTLCQLKAH
jgi:hypothetical protein